MNNQQLKLFIETIRQSKDKDENEQNFEIGKYCIKDDPDCFLEFLTATGLLYHLILRLIDYVDDFSDLDKRDDLIIFYKKAVINFYKTYQPFNFDDISCSLEDHS